MKQSLLTYKNSNQKQEKQALGLPLLDNSVITARKARLDTEVEWGDKSGATMRRIRRFYQRFFTGVAVGGRLRFLTLTSSDAAVAEGLDIHRSWRCLLMRLRRRFGAFEYIGVREIKSDRQHLHLVFRGSYIEQLLISDLWVEIHHSPIVDIRAMYKVRGGARELAKYIGKEICNRYWCSYNWVFRGWVSWSRKVRQVRGYFPSKTILAILARISDRAKRKLALFALCPELGLDYG